MARVRAPSVTPIEQLGVTQVPLHCSGPGFCLGDAPLAQRQSNGLLIRRFWVRNPGGANEEVRQTRSSGAISVPCVPVSHPLSQVACDLSPRCAGIAPAPPHCSVASTAVLAPLRC